MDIDMLLIALVIVACIGLLCCLLWMNLKEYKESSIDPSDIKGGEITLKGFINWLKGQPPNKKYRYMNRQDCLVAQYYRYCGVPYKVYTIPVGKDGCYIADISDIRISDAAAIENIAVKGTLKESTIKDALEIALEVYYKRNK